MTLLSLKQARGRPNRTFPNSLYTPQAFLLQMKANNCGSHGRVQPAGRGETRCRAELQDRDELQLLFLLITKDIRVESDHVKLLYVRTVKQLNSNDQLSYR